MVKKRKPSVGIIGTKGYPYIYSGYETFVTELSDLLKDKFEIHIYCQRSLFKNKQSKHNGIYLHYVPAVQNKYLAHITHGFLCTIHALFKKFDIVFYLNVCYGPFGYIYKFLHRHTIINTDGLEWLRPEVKKIGSKFYYWTAYHATRSFHVIISDSEAIADVYKKEFNVASTVITYGANIYYSHDTRKLNNLNLQKNQYYLVVGRLFPSNNINYIVKTFIRLKSSRKLVVVGGQFFPDRYEKEIKMSQSNQIIFTGFVEDRLLMSELYANAYCYIHGHEFGGTNPSLLNALAHGCCVIALDTPFNREVLLEDRYGLYFQKRPESLLDTMNWIDQFPEIVQKYKAKSRERIVSNYTWEKISKQYEKLFNKILYDTYN